MKTTFSINYTHQHGIRATIPKGDEMAKFAAEAYGYALNTDEHIGKDLDARQFAAAIRDMYCLDTVQNRAVVRHLENL